LPRTYEKAEPASVSLAEPDLHRTSNQQALLIEDNPEVAEVAASYLSELGFEVEHTLDADEALRKLRTKRYDLALSDIVMPGGLSGFDLARTLRNHHPELPIVLASGYSEKAGEAVAEGFILLSKPYSAAALSRAIEIAQSQKGRFRNPA
jgi:two-component system NtrC family sensor kinase